MIVRRLIPAGVFLAIFVAHALYVGARAASAPSGWSDFGMSATASGPLGLGAYWRAQEYFMGFSYAAGASLRRMGAHSLHFFSPSKGRRRWSCCGWYHSGRCAHGGWLFSDRLLRLTHAGRICELVRC